MKLDEIYKNRKIKTHDYSFVLTSLENMEMQP